MGFAHMKTQWFSGFFFVAHMKTQAALEILGRWPSNGYSRQYRNASNEALRGLHRLLQ